ncbi:MAG: hypothetical protein MJZ46_03515 [Bacteroidales bacterium]|nr:hypothetical protein [Bacteroidales bacterium]
MVYEFKYDNKRNPFSVFYNAFDFEIDYFSLQYDRTFNFINTNNIVECTMSVPSSSGQIAPVVIKYEYTYSDDYPTSQIITDEHNGTVIKTTILIYKICNFYSKKGGYHTAFFVSFFEQIYVYICFL